jgi:uncharacterized OB-fold protein
MHGPAIERDDDSAPFFDAARRDELVVRRCSACDRWLAPQARSCPGCGGDLAWVPASGSGTLVTWARVHSAPHEAFAGQLPYLTGYVELAEGPWLLARIAAGPEQPQMGAALRVAFVHPAEGESYPIFQPSPAD